MLTDGSENLFYLAYGMPQSRTSRRAGVEHATNNASVIPPAISVAEGKKDLDLANALRPILQQLNSLVESVDDTMMAAGVEAKDFADNFYNIVKVMATTNTPGMTAIAQDLAVFYEKATTVVTPTPPTP